jgi:hypothetical protein
MAEFHDEVSLLMELIAGRPEARPVDLLEDLGWPLIMSPDVCLLFRTGVCMTDLANVVVSDRLAL